MIKHILASVVLGIAATAYQTQCLAAGGDWYPKASDRCAEYVTKVRKLEQGDQSHRSTKDSAIAKYVSEFNAAFGTNDKGEVAMLFLLGYCQDHAATKLGSVTAKATIAHFNARSAAIASTGKPWYPKASDSCAEFITNMTSGSSKLVTPRKDAEVYKYVSEFNAATGTNDDSGLMALVSLLGYCGKHAFARLGDVTAQAVIADTAELNANKPTSSTQLSPEQQAQVEQIAGCGKQCLDYCAADEQCKKMCTKTMGDSFACVAGIRPACDARDRGLAELERLGAQKRSATPQPSPEQRAQWNDQAAIWLKDSLDVCAGNRIENHDECRRIAKKTYDDAIACNNTGNRKSCSDRDNDRIEFGRWQRAQMADEWALWLKQMLEYCGTNEHCKEVANRQVANNLRCTQGDELACKAHARDVADWNAEYRPPQAQAPQAAPQDALMKCLQDTADAVIRSCNANPSCDNALTYRTIGAVQRMRCGYSAIDPIRPIQMPYQAPRMPELEPRQPQIEPRQPQIDYSCLSNLQAARVPEAQAQAMCTH